MISIPVRSQAKLLFAGLLATTLPLPATLLKINRDLEPEGDPRMPQAI